MILLAALYYGLLQQSSSSLINNTILKILEQACGLVVGLLTCVLQIVTDSSPISPETFISMIHLVLYECHSYFVY